MTLFGVTDFTLSYFQNQWTDFDNFCILLMRNQCYVLWCKNLKIAESIHSTHFGREGHVCTLLVVGVTQQLHFTNRWGSTGNAHFQQLRLNGNWNLPAVEVKQKLDVTNRYSTGVRLYQQLRLISNWNLPAVEVKKQWDFTSSWG